VASVVALEEGTSPRLYLRYSPRKIGGKSIKVSSRDRRIRFSHHSSSGNPFSLEGVSVDGFGEAPGRVVDDAFGNWIVIGELALLGGRRIGLGHR
jgi:hypothetical protein